METYKPVRILLVEDNPDDVLITRRALAKSRVANELYVVRDGQEALDYLFRGPDDPDAPRPDLIRIGLEGGFAGIDDDKIVAETVHLEERAGHAALYRAYPL